MSKSDPHFPHFIGIGAARAGTTWLSHQLGQHPDIWMPRIKELHYFTRSHKYEGPSQLEDANFLRRLFSRKGQYWKYRHIMFRAIGSNILRPSIKKLSWDMNYLLRTPNDRWYASLFSQGEGKVTGEITPRYSMLDGQDISKLKALMPGVKIFFVMRDPVERAWSLIKYHEKRGGEPLTERPYAELKALAFADVILQQSDYESILTRWRGVFPRDQFLEIFFDEIREEPDELLRRIQNFLGVRPFGSSISDKGRTAKVNPSFSKPMPEPLREELVRHFRPMVERLAAAEGGYFAEWLKSYREVTSDTAVSCG